MLSNNHCYERHGGQGPWSGGRGWSVAKRQLKDLWSGHTGQKSSGRKPHFKIENDFPSQFTTNPQIKPRPTDHDSKTNVQVTHRKTAANARIALCSSTSGALRFSRPNAMTQLQQQLIQYQTNIAISALSVAFRATPAEKRQKLLDIVYNQIITTVFADEIITGRPIIPELSETDDDQQL